MARPIWRGSLSFGLVAIPVQLHTAVRENRPKFRLLHAKDKSPIKYERVCQRDGKPVAWEDLVKGYEYQRGRYVVLTKEDFKAAALEKDRRVQVTDFVPAEDDRRSLLRSPVLPAARQGWRACLCGLPRRPEAHGPHRHRQSGHARSAASRRRSRASSDHLVLTMMRFADEIVEAPEMPVVERIKVPARELKLASDLIGALGCRLEAGAVHRRLPGEPAGSDQGQAQGRDRCARRRRAPRCAPKSSIWRSDSRPVFARRVEGGRRRRRNARRSSRAHARRAPSPSGNAQPRNRHPHSPKHGSALPSLDHRPVISRHQIWHEC